MDQSNSGGRTPANPGPLAHIALAPVEEPRDLEEGIDATRAPETAESLLSEVRQEEDASEGRQIATAAPAEPGGRVRYLDDSERGRLLRAAKASGEPNLYPMVVLALATGMRQGEALNLIWADVDFGQGWVVLRDAKNGERRTSPLGRAAAEALHEHAKVRRLDTQLVFPSALVDKAIFPRAAWEHAIAAAEIADVRFHDLRHSTASYLAMQGASLMESADVLGGT